MEGEVWENPVTRERATILELPYKNAEGRATAELTAHVGARVVGEHRHPGLVERFTVLEGELTVKLAGRTAVLRAGETAVVELALFAQEFSDVIVFRSPPAAVQRTLFAVLAPIARWRGYRSTYPQLSRVLLAHRL